ncbi:AAA family ATPase [Anaerocellum diazotrophicum]|uniref:Chaperone n=1 Tax=Caldicellulosiruptor diazotrophicus TaxID=2806205 RepID=A0ABN6EA39_9FIRM|nr:AAA family ATPase [Caldicellulosiruptor diazotrophicus]BCS82417.1 chaperone [Caldicellulosiruptor diazotrophicus]
MANDIIPEKIKGIPKFAKELLRFCSITCQFVLFGNIYDLFPFPQGEKYIPMNITQFIAHLLTTYDSYKIVIEYVPLEGFRLLKGDEGIFTNLSGRKIGDKVVTLLDAYETIEKFITGDEKAAVVINFSSRLPEISCSRDLPDFLYHTFKLSININQKGNPPSYNPIIFLVEKENDLPPWYTVENPRIRTIPIPKPDFEIRRWIAQALLPRMDEWTSLPESKKEELIKDFVNLTSGMFAREMLSIVVLSKRENLSAREIGEATRRYKVGVSENPWAKIDKERLNNAEEFLKRRVMGQEKAIKQAATILRRAFFNLSGSQFSRYSNRPKGVLFFAGPTGVGKTELAKAITELIFGSEHHYIRFDMSEFSHEHSDQRLIGAPPGYVGYDVGGELTNAVKQNPFSVILFDEIEKAHPKILDIFLQILDDGRLTSGRGETVYFSETLIIFTSNLGVYEVTSDGKKIQRISPGMSYDEIEKILTEAIKEYFTFKIARPEILNRIGENIIVFDFIRNENVKKILDKMLNNVRIKLEEDKGIKLEISDNVQQKIYEEIVKDLSMGGRGIGNKLELLFINPLSELLFKLFPQTESTVVVNELVKKDDRWELNGRVVG